MNDEGTSLNVLLLITDDCDVRQCHDGNVRSNWPMKGQFPMNVPEFVHLNDVKQDRDDFHADVWLRRVQINDQQTVSFRRPDGMDTQLNLTRHVREGTILRLAGKGVGGRGHLVLHVRLIDF